MTLDDILAKVTDIQATAATVVAELKAGAVDPAKVQQISDALDGVKQTLTAAVPAA